MTVQFHPRVLELMASRVCHDLVSPVGAISNGVELLEELGEAAGAEALGLIASSSAQAGLRLKVFRLCYGAAGTDKNIGFKDVAEVFSSLTKGGRVQLKLEEGILSKFPSPSRGFFKIVLNAMILAEECTHGEGEIFVSAVDEAASALRLSVTGRNPAFRDGVETALKGETDPEELDARSIHAYLTSRFAAHFGIALSWQAFPEEARLEFIVKA